MFFNGIKLCNIFASNSTFLKSATRKSFLLQLQKFQQQQKNFSKSTSFFFNHHVKMSTSAGLVTGLDDKVVLITGASSGMGRYAAIEFSKNNAKLAICGRKEDALNETLEMCLKDGNTKRDNILQIVADLEKEEECKRIVANTVKKFGQLDVLVNSAGILVGGSIETIKLEDYDRQMNINCRSILIICQESVPHLKLTNGNIVNVSSVTGTRSFPGVLPYCISKAALDQMTCCMALELAPYKVRVNSVNPGVIVTNCHKNAGMDEEAYKAFLKHSEDTHPLKRVGTADEVAKSIVFLSSEKLSGFMTGVLLAVDGGRGIACPR